jgi:hypothetical protein
LPIKHPPPTTRLGDYQSVRLTSNSDTGVLGCHVVCSGTWLSAFLWCMLLPSSLSKLTMVYFVLPFPATGTLCSSSIVSLIGCYCPLPPHQPHNFFCPARGPVWCPSFKLHVVIRQKSTVSADCLLPTSAPEFYCGLVSTLFSGFRSYACLLTFFECLFNSRAYEQTLTCSLVVILSAQPPAQPPPRNPGSSCLR